MRIWPAALWLLDFLQVNPVTGQLAPTPPSDPTMLVGVPASSGLGNFLAQHSVLPSISIWLLVAALIVIFWLYRLISSDQFKGWIGERIVIHAGLRKLDSSLYSHFHDLYLPRLDGQGTTRIHHVVVSPFGIFVIETRNCPGWISGQAGQNEWTKRLYKHKSAFPNPLHDAEHHVAALRVCLGLPENRFHPLVIFLGGTEFEGAMPENVINRGLLTWIKGHTNHVLGPTALQQAHRRLTDLSRNTDRRAAARRHLKSLKARKPQLPANAMDLEFQSWSRTPTQRG